MLKELADLTIEADGRYAQDYELQFLEEYLKSQDVRISAYNKINNSVEKIIEQVKLVKQKKNPDFTEFSKICHRDLNILILHCAAALLFDDLERLRTNMLMWYQSIARAYHYDNDNSDTYDALLKVMPQFFTNEELKVVLPVFELNQVILA